MGQLTPDELEAGLKRFYGSEMFPLYLDGLRMTEGVQWLCEHAGAYWLLDCLASYQTLPQVARERFQVIDLHVDLALHMGRIEVGDGNDNIVFVQEIPYTDFPLPKLRLYFTDSTVMLPREY